MRLRLKIKYLMEYIGLRLFCCIVKALPDSIAIKTGRRLGGLSARFLKNRIRLAHSNLQLAYRESLSYDQRTTIIYELLSLMGEALIESIIFKTADIKKNITVEGMEHIANALKMNKSAIVLVPHYGLWELASYVFGAYVKNASVVYKPLKNYFINNYLIKNRQKSNLALIPNKNALRMIMGNLKKGFPVGILFDQNAGKEGLPATFFGKTALTYSAPAAFALKTGCPVIPAYITMEPGFRKHRLVIKEPFPLIDTGNKEKDLLANTQQYNDFLEALVLSHPGQWFGWFHKRWKIPRKYRIDQKLITNYNRLSSVQIIASEKNNE